MRLVDADALLKRKGCVYDSESHVLFAVGTGDIVHSPTIDAIPVDWLREKMRGYASTLKSTELSAVVCVMQMWDKEQGAQDG